jgi:chromosome segregation ATPase
VSAYTDQLQKIRAARKERDDARDVLYGLKMGHLSLRRDRRKTHTGYVEPDPQAERAIAALREQLAATQRRLAEIENFGKTVDALTQRLDEIDALRKKYEQEARDTRDDGKLAALRRRIAALQQEAEALRA